MFPDPQYNSILRTGAPLVPEIKLHLITPQCSLWRSPPEDCPVSDPYWAFFWPGGQALCRYLLDNPWICKNKVYRKSVLILYSTCPHDHWGVVIDQPQLVFSVN